MSNDILKKCEISELDRIDKFYRYVSENTANMNQYGKWSFGLHLKSEQIKTILDPVLCIIMKITEKYSERLL